MEFIFDDMEEEDQVKLVGHLNRRYGYVGYITSEEGTEVFEERDKYFFYSVHEVTGKKERKSFYKDGGFKNHVNFI